jgi:ADP-heptose:LPS heptosyltransferase
MNMMSFCYHGFRIGLADIVTAFDKRTIGSKVVDEHGFLVALADAMVAPDSFANHLAAGLPKPPLVASYWASFSPAPLHDWIRTPQ